MVYFANSHNRLGILCRNGQRWLTHLMPAIASKHCFPICDKIRSGRLDIDDEGCVFELSVFSVFVEDRFHRSADVFRGFLVRGFKLKQTGGGTCSDWGECDGGGSWQGVFYSFH